MNRIHLNRIVIGTVLLPMILGGLILWSLGDRAERSDRVPTAVVNADKIVYRHGKPVYAGRLLAAELTSPREADRNSLGWELTDARDAQEGLRDGDYYAVLTIPQDFSKTIAGLQGTDPETAGITVRTNDSSSALVGEISRQVGDIAANRLGHRITATFIEGVLSKSGCSRNSSARPPPAPAGSPTATTGSPTAPTGSVMERSGSSTVSGGWPVGPTGSPAVRTGSPQARTRWQSAPTGCPTACIGPVRDPTGSPEGWPG